MIEERRQRILGMLNSRWIYGRVIPKGFKTAQLTDVHLQPLLHTLVFLTEMFILTRLVSRFNSYYNEKPLLTMMVTNAILSGIADTVAQSITAVRQRALRKPGGVTPDDFVAIEITELDKKIAPTSAGLIPPSRMLPPPFDFERLTRFMSYGFLIAPVQFKWFQLLSRTFPTTKTSATIPAMQRMLADQLILGPIGLGVFFTFMTVAEGGGKRAVLRKLQDVYIPALKAQYMIWPAVQIINFRVMPVRFQLPFVSTIGIAWTVYLSLTNSAEDVAAPAY